jgi:dinuclear metal center YbgI/SA1388 family protein
MPLPTGTLISYLEQLAPRRLAQDWDNTGLQLGSFNGTVEKILVALDVDDLVVDEAVSLGAGLIIAHHPLIFRPLQSLRTDLPQGRLLAKALAAGLTVYAMHTNLDAAAGGVNDVLAGLLGLRDTEVLKVTARESFEKIVVFVPSGHEDNVRRAMAAAGAGWIGNYSHCTFQAPGTGTFLPHDGTNPFIGEQGKLEKVAELRLETIYPSRLRNRVVQAMLRAHPYEEAAYDIYQLQNEGRPFGLGRVGRLSSPVALTGFCQLVREKLAVSTLRVTGDPDLTLKKVAVCGGAGADLIRAAHYAGADVLVTGDLKYHEARDAASVNLAVIDAGHDATEKVIVPALCDYLRAKISEDGHQAEVFASAVPTAPWRVFPG